MTLDEGNRGDGRFSSLKSALRRRQDDRIEVRDYQIGDIRAENAVVVSSGAILVGDVLAPEVVVSGLVYGYVACRRLTVAPGGQVWGDVYVSSLELAPSGKINGWVCTLDAGTVDLLRAGELRKGDLPDHDDRHLPADLLQRIQNSGADIEADQSESQRRTGIWRQLRSEAALALIARAEIEATVDQRLESALASHDSEPNGQEQEPDSDVEAPRVAEAADSGYRDESKGEKRSDSEERRDAAELEKLHAQLQQATAAAQKYYGELLWTRAELRAVRRGESNS